MTFEPETTAGYSKTQIVA